MALSFSESSATIFSRVIPGRQVSARPEHDGGLDHFHRGGIGGGFGPAELAGGGFHLGQALNHAILPGHDALHFGQGSAGHEDGHEEQAAFVEGRHEFAADAAGQDTGPNEEDHGDGQHGPAVPQRPAEGGAVEAGEKPHDDVVVLGVEGSTHEPGARTGTSVTPSKVAPIMAKVLVKASGWKSLPS